MPSNSDSNKSKGLLKSCYEKIVGEAKNMDGIIPSSPLKQVTFS